MKEKNVVRLDKFLANSGFSSRRSVRKFLKENVLTVNGVEVRDPEMKVAPEKDSLVLNGEEIREERFVYYVLNKPKNVISTTSDELGREDVTAFIETGRTIYPIGRLDKDTAGLILLTDDGELTHQLTHPRYHVEKVYRLTIDGTVSDEQLETLRTGVALKDGKTLPAKVKVISSDKGQTMLELGIIEGRNRQIRRMCWKLEINLLELKRIAFGPINLGELTEGEYRELGEKEIEALREIVKK